MSEVKLSHEELEDMLDRAARRGAKEALRSIGLLDDDVHKDNDTTIAYRQALRDITSHVNFPFLNEEDWPVKPV